MLKRIALAAVLFGGLAVPAFAQAPAVATPAIRPTMTAPTMTAPTVTAPTVTAPTVKPPAAMGKMVNLNTASATDLDSLPGVGKARSKAIVTERAKGNFKDWADFDKRMNGTNVNTGVRSKIKDLVTF